MVNKNKEVTTVASEETFARLRQNMPVEEGFTRTSLPRLGMFSQDQTEGKGKQMKVVIEAGTFYIEKPTEETNEDGKKVWEKEELGLEIEGIIIFHRRQLKYFDGTSFVNSTVYDEPTDIVKLFQNGAEIAVGTEAELKALDQFQKPGEVDAKGNPKSLLKDNRILYVLYKGEMYQMTLGGTSMYAWMKYARTVTAPGVVTRMNSEYKENGNIAWNQMTFEKVKTISEDEAQLVEEKQEEIKTAVAQEKAFYASRDAMTVKAKVDLDVEFDSGPREKQNALPSGRRK